MVQAMQRGGTMRTVGLIAAMCAALAVSACGRKSGLDLPPSAAASAPASAAGEPEPQAQQEARSLTSPLAKPAKPQPRVVPNRTLPIDILLN
jgi:predicted small lipoprotein YifL